ncbi:MAG: hypothetical protein HQK53_04600 [Oligoflexia bacterium]|nr:hypothetical protein [Oligoflexia bacterium]
MLRERDFEKRNLKYICERIYGFDHDERSLMVAKKNLKIIFQTLGFDSDYSDHGDVGKISIKKQDALTLIPPLSTGAAAGATSVSGASAGVIFCNPPYGKRLDAELQQLESLYHEYGENLKKNFKNYRAYVLTGNLDLRKAIALKTTSRAVLYNGDIECRLLRYDLY